MLNNYQIKEVNDTEKGLIFKQILTQKTWSFAYYILVSQVQKLKNFKELFMFRKCVNLLKLKKLSLPTVVREVKRQ